jgi:hypothetical protein
MSERIALTEAERDYLIAEQARRKIPWKVLAWRVGVSKVELSYWRRGIRRPTGEQLLNWWRAVSDTS